MGLDTARPRSLSVDDGRRALLAGIARMAKSERVELKAALGRVLAAPVISAIDIPAVPTAAMDGYALLAAAIERVPVTLAIAGTAFAGGPHATGPGLSACIRIMTGAPLPPETDTVVMQEDVQRSADAITLTSLPAPGAHVRLTGEDIALADHVVAAGRRLTPVDIARAAMLGLTHLEVYRQLKVGFLSSGDELALVGGALGPGEVYDSNRYFLHCAIASLGMQPVDCGRVDDDRDAITAALKAAAPEVDVLLTTGGTSMGDRDHMKGVLQEGGTLIFGEVAMKPGRPLGFGHYAGMPVVTLPGTPAAMMAAFYVMLRDALMHASGESPHRVARIRARLGGTLTAKGGRHEFIQTSLVLRRDEAIAQPIRRRFHRRESDALLPTLDGWIELDGTQTRINSGDTVDVIPL
jgi:molybdopterin molybdotransferase